MNSEIVDYKKKYEAVLQTAKQWISDGCSDTVKIAIEAIFPEFRESEDERIRKNCIHFLELQKGHHADTSEIDNCISWLKVRGEFNIERIQRSWYMQGYHDGENNREPKWIITAREGGPRYEDNPRYGLHLTEDKKEQKPELKQNMPRWKRYGSGACGGVYDFAIMRCGKRNYMLTKTLANGDQYLTFDDLESLPMED